MSRKTLLGIIGVIGAILVVFQSQFGLTINTTEIVAGLTAIMLYILFEGKADIKRIGEQKAKFKDPKFWIAIGSGVVVSLNSTLGLNLPVEIIVSVLTFLMSLLFGKDALATA